MDFANVNFVAILVAALANVFLGALWYSPLLFGKQWMKLANMKKEDMNKKDGNKAMIGSLIGALITGYVLANLIAVINVVTVSGAILFSFWIWLGFVATSTLAAVLYEKKKPALYYIYNLYYFVGLALMSIIIAMWK